MEIKDIFGSRVLEQRKKMSLSQGELGSKIGLTHKAISTIESGKRGTSFEKLVELAYVFQVSADYLLGITDDPTWRGKTTGEHPQKPPFERRCPSSQTGAEDCILAKPKYAKQTRLAQTWFTSYVRFANAILSQPSADSPFQKGPFGCYLFTSRLSVSPSR